ncbi:AN1-type zinc finger protein 1-like [Acanthaster planci]|uniref:AN1-type zinc finger protein 1-like n=1 Tax=Acanthaster planci TaxID=133434 RepID=A0A8B7YKR5_ACAPL|nr:AN1-type zinc finger protein 1-like [Acanthaster planci]
MAELDIGKHCSVKSCKQLDFLPFQCTGCSEIFCLEHRSFDAHCCSQANITQDHKDFGGPTSYECSFPGCEDRELIPVSCQHCGNNYCLSHRHQQDHECTKLVEALPRMAKTAELVEQIQESYKAKGATVSKRKIGAKSQQTAAKVALMKMKMNALGDKAIPQSERLYFKVALPREHDSDLKGQAIFFSSVWSVGRAIDKVASIVKLRNDNNVATAKKLRLFHPETGEILPVDMRLSSLLEGETPLYNGGCVILEYVKESCTVLEHIADYL